MFIVMAVVFVLGYTGIALEHPLKVDKAATALLTGVLLWILSIITFFMSAALDNLTATIVMVALLRKLIASQHDRWFIAGMVVLAANAGGAWSPIGDVTTTMLWIGGQITVHKIIPDVFLPSVVTIVVPLLIITFFYHK